MTVKTTMVWTPLPAGWNGSTLRLSVLLSPRVEWVGGGTKTLDDVPNFRGSTWPGLAGTPSMVAGGLGFSVTFTTVGPVTAPSTSVTRVSPDPDGSLFATMFPTSTTVKPWIDRDFSALAFRSFSLSALSDMLDEFQESVSPAQRPSIDSLYLNGKGLLAPVAIDAGERARQADASANALSSAKATPVPDVSTKAGKTAAVAQLLDYLEPTRTEDQLALALLWKPPEFHEMLALFGSHPSLLRRLGFLFDLEVTPPIGMPTGPSVYVSVTPEYSPAGGADTVDVTPSVVCTIAGSTVGSGTFELKAGTSDVTSDGVVNLSGWTAVTSEAEHEAISHAAMAGEIQRAATQGLRSIGSPVQAGLPARRSAGIAVTRPGMATAFHALMVRSWEVQQEIRTGTSLYAEDVAVGYRLDVRRDGGDWRTLHRRRGTLTPEGGAPIDLGIDESWAEHSFADDTLANVRRIPETLVRWSGWSLALPRPGKFVADDNTLMGAPSALPEGVHAGLTYAAPASLDGGAHLPALRFGSTYDLRLRLVDPAGRSRAPGASASTLTVDYLRHEPVGSTDIYVIGTETRGEQPDVLVVRSEGGGAAVPGSAPTSRRMLVPPRGPVWLAEQHGRLDETGTGAPKKSVYADLVARDAATFDPTVDPATFVPTSYAVPYLPDPMALGTRVRGGPKSGNAFTESVTASFGGTWPARTALEIRAIPSASQSTAAASGIITARIAPGRVAHLRVSSTILQADLELFDLWARRSDPALAAAAAGGMWWQLTPDRIVRVVHATRRPASAPRFLPANTWKVTRPLAETAVRLTGSVTADRPSTASLTVTGTLTSGVDRGPGIGDPAIVESDAGSIAIVDLDDPAPGGSEGSVAVSARIPLPDTTCRLLSLGATATSRFADYFRRTRTMAIALTDTELAPTAQSKAIVPGSVRVAWSSHGQSRSGKEGVDFSVDADKGTIKRIGTGIPAGQVEVSWIPGAITLTTMDTPDAGQRRAGVIIPSTKRPDPPSAAWVVPTFEWNSPKPPTALDPKVTSTRSGGGLRVYLRRPWWSSGLGERLAVVLRSTRSSAGDPANELVTRWGADPVTTGALPPIAWPTPQTFANRDGQLIDVDIAELPGKKVDIALYSLGQPDGKGGVTGFDADRDLWWVDLELAQGLAYRPFVRLALARYQPNADESVRLSAITVLDVVQLEPDRTATLVIAPPLGAGTKVKASVTLTGPSYASNSAGSGPGRAWLIHEASPVADPDHERVQWEEIGRVEMKASYAASRGTWTGTLDVPASRPAGRNRLVVEQYEQWRTDGTDLAPGSAKVEYGLRLVHQDILAI